MAVNKKTKTKKSAEENGGTNGDKKLDALIKKYGGGMLKMGMTSKDDDIKRISTGVLGIDKIFGQNEDGQGGVPEGRICEFYGPSASGKTSLALYVMANAQREGKRVAFIDVEQAMSYERMASLGVDTDKVIFARPNFGEEALELARELMQDGLVDLIVIDSVSALLPRAEMEAEIGKNSIGLQSRLMSSATRILCPVAQKSNTTLIFINQVRMKIGVMYGNPETTSGGNALGFYSSLRVRVSGTKKIEENGVPIGKEVTIQTVKNKTASPFRKGTFVFLDDSGFSIEADLLTIATDLKVVTRAGAWYFYFDPVTGEKLTVGQGMPKAIKWFKDNPDKKDEIEALCKLKMMSKDEDLETEEAEEESQEEEVTEEAV